MKETSVERETHKKKIFFPFYDEPTNRWSWWTSNSFQEAEENLTTLIGWWQLMVSIITCQKPWCDCWESTWRNMRFPGFLPSSLKKKTKEQLCTIGKSNRKWRGCAVQKTITQDFTAFCFGSLFLFSLTNWPNCSAWLRAMPKRVFFAPSERLSRPTGPRSGVGIARINLPKFTLHRDFTSHCRTPWHWKGWTVMERVAIYGSGDCKS